MISGGGGVTELQTQKYFTAYAELWRAFPIGEWETWGGGGDAAWKATWWNQST